MHRLSVRIRALAARGGILAMLATAGGAGPSRAQPAAPVPPPKAASEAASGTLAPVRIWWPLEPVRRRGAEGEYAAPVLPAEATLIAVPADAGQAPTHASPPPSDPSQAPRVAAAIPIDAGSVTGSEAPEDPVSAAPVTPKDPRVDLPPADAARPILAPPPAAATPVPSPIATVAAAAGEGAGASSPAPAAARVSPNPKGEAPRKPETDLSFGLPPDLALPRIQATLPESGLASPTPDVRRWTYAAPEGGLSWESQESTKDGDSIVLRGQVDIRAGVERIQADEVRLDQKTLKLEAVGNVVLDRLDARMTGQSLEYDVKTNTGVVHEALGFTGEDFSFTAKIAEKVGPDKYLLRDATFTSCTQPGPFWQVRASKAIVHVDRFVYMWNPRIVFGKVPSFYLPWIAIPIREKRTTGFMIPRIGNSSVRGFHASEEFFWAINRQADLTVGGTYWSDYGWRGDLGARWFLDGMPDYGFIRGAFLHRNEDQTIETDLGHDRYDVKWEHRQTFGEWDLTATGEIASDQFLEYDTPGDEGIGDLNPVFNQKFTFQRSWGKHSLNLTAENDERERILTTREVAHSPAMPPPDFTHLVLSIPSVIGGGTQPNQISSFGSDTSINQRLPLAEYRASGLQLGGKKWVSLSMEGSIGSLRKINDVEYNYDYGLDPVHPTLPQFPDPIRVQISDTLMSHSYERADFYPQLRFPVGTAWLQVIPRIGVRGTWWTKQEDVPRTRPGTRIVAVPLPGTAGEIGVTYVDTVDEGLFMWGWDAGLKLEGPDFSRIFNLDALPGQRKWQHLIEPSIEFSYAPELDSEPIIEGDQLRSHYQQRFPVPPTPTLPAKKGTLDKMNLRLVNTLRTKMTSAPGEKEEQARDWLIWTLSTDYDFVKPASSRRFLVETPPPPDPPVYRTEKNWWGNVLSDFNFKPSERTHVSLRNTYDVILDDLTDTTLASGFGGGWGYVDLSFNTRRDTTTADVTNTDLSLTGEHWFYKGDRIRIGYDISRKLDEKNPPPGSDPWLYRRIVFSYYNQCLGFSLSWEDQNLRQSSSTLPPEQEFIFTISLKDLGNFLRYKRGLD